MWQGKGKAVLLIAGALAVFVPPTAVILIIRNRRENEVTSLDDDRTHAPSTVDPPSSDYEKNLGTSASPVKPMPTTLSPSNRLSDTITNSSSLSTPIASPTVFTPSVAPSKESDPLVVATTFYAIADVPYDLVEMTTLPTQLQSIPSDAEFVIHLGDIRKGSERMDCKSDEFGSVAETLRLSRAPVFIVLGDNEWNDCPNVDEAWTFWNEHFGAFENHWNHTFDVYRPNDRKENFAFVHKKILFIGLNLVGGSVHDAVEWSTRLTQQAAWVKTMVENHTGGHDTVSQVNSVIIFGHAYPSEHHTEFFNPLHDYVQNELDKDIAVLFMHGDGHHWLYEPNFLGQSNFLRIQLTGGTIEPPLKITVNSSKKAVNTADAFRYDRRL